MRVAEDVHTIEHRRVQGGDWVRVQIVGDDMLEWAEDMVVAYNEQSGCGDWRIRYAGQKPEPTVAAERTFAPPSIRERVRFWWVMRFSKRAR